MKIHHYEPEKAKLIGLSCHKKSQEEQIPNDSTTKEQKFLHSVDYHDYLLTEFKQDPLVACVGNEATDDITKRWLEDVLCSLNWSEGSKGDKIMELMAGYGRNFPVLTKFFHLVEMLDGSKEMTKLN